MILKCANFEIGFEISLAATLFTFSFYNLLNVCIGYIRCSQIPILPRTSSIGIKHVLSVDTICTYTKVIFACVRIYICVHVHMCVMFLQWL